MNKLCLLIIIFVAGFLALLPPASFAANRPGAITLTVGGGYAFFDPKRDINNTGMPFIEAGYNFNQHWAFTGYFSSFSTDFNNSSDERDINGTEFAVDVLYRFSPVMQIVEPFVLAGPGISSFNPNINGDAHTQGNINAGVGAQVFIDKSVALTFEARDFYQIVSATNDVILNAGVSFLLDIC